ncbi:MAG: hypothetical protein HYY16_08210 [Planctomycetes bacterium]|nr:hypothetical protein [Planctomycetota bacterium]
MKGIARMSVAVLLVTHVGRVHAWPQDTGCPDASHPSGAHQCGPSEIQNWTGVDPSKPYAPLQDKDGDGVLQWQDENDRDPSRPGSSEPPSPPKRRDWKDYAQRGTDVLHLSLAAADVASGEVRWEAWFGASAAGALSFGAAYFTVGMGFVLLGVPGWAMIGVRGAALMAGIAAGGITFGTVYNALRGPERREQGGAADKIDALRITTPPGPSWGA